MTYREFVKTGSGWTARRILQPIAPLLARNSTLQAARVRAITDRERSCRGSLGAVIQNVSGFLKVGLRTFQAEKPTLAFMLKRGPMPLQPATATHATPATPYHNGVFMSLSHPQQAPSQESQGSHHYAHALPEQPPRIERPQDKPLWRQTVAVCNSLGEEEAFTVGPDGCVWNFFRDPAVDSGYSLINLNMPTDALAVSHDSDGRMVVFSASGMTLLYRVELPSTPGKPQSTAAQRWSAVVEVALPLVLGAVAVKRLFVTDVFDAMHIGAVVRLETADHREGFVMAYAKWTPNGLAFPEPSILLDGDPRCASQRGGFADSRRAADPTDPTDPTDTTFPGELPLRSVLVRPWRIGVKTALYR